MSIRKTVTVCWDLAPAVTQAIVMEEKAHGDAARVSPEGLLHADKATFSLRSSPRPPGCKTLTEGWSVV